MQESAWSVRIIRLSALTLFTSILSVTTGVSQAVAVAPRAASLIGQSGGTLISNVTGSPSNICDKPMRGITTDGTHIYYRVSLASGSVTICKATLAGAYVTHAVISNSNIDGDQRDLAYSNGCLLIRSNTGVGDSVPNKNLYCVLASNLSTVQQISIPSGYELPAGQGWMNGNIADLPDGRIGVMGQPSATAANTVSGLTCAAGKYCKLFRTYSVSGSAPNLTLSFSKDYVLEDVSASWPSDEHGIASDGTYIYEIRHQGGYRVWGLAASGISTLAFNGHTGNTTNLTTYASNSGCQASSGISSDCSIMAPESGVLFSNATFITHNHTTGRYIYADYDSLGAKFYITPGFQSISFSQLSNRTKTLNTDTFTVSASANSGLSVTFSSATASKCSVSSITVTLIAPGTCTINANQAGNSTYNAAEQVSQSFTIADTFTVTTPTSGLGSTSYYPYTLSISTSGGSGNNIYAISSGTLPTGISLNTTTGVISGTPSVPGSSNISVQVTDSNTTTITTSNFTLVVNDLNSFTSSTTKITQKYGSGKTTRTVTTTGGTDTKTITATSNSLASGKILFNNGILTVDTATPAGTYYDTITVTDALGAIASYVQEISVTVADTLTVQADTLTAITYSPNGMSINTTSTISGLVASDSENSVTYTFSEPSSTCAGGSSCSLGDTGPGGGKIFYISGSTYYEAAPKTWYSTVTYNGSTYTNSNIHFCSDANYFHKNTNFSYTINTGWGGGQSNTAAFVSNGCPTGVVALSQQYRGGGLSDWYVPNETELNGLVAYWSNLNSLSTQFAAMSNSFYWTSNATTWNATYGWLFTQPYFNAGGTWTLAGAAYNNQTGLFVPIRKFTSAGGSENLLGNPTNAGTYTITPSALTLANSVSTSNYVNVVYRSSTFVINKATQDTLTITSKIGTYNGGTSTLKIATAGGSDTGTVSYAVDLANSTASGCAVEGNTLTFTSAGTCTLTANKAATRNYLIAYADTVTITLSAFVSNQQTQTQSVPTQLPINGANSLDLTQTNTIPEVSSVSLVGGTYEIVGSGFSGVNRVVIGGVDATIVSNTATKIVINSAGLMPGPLFIECSDGRIGPSPFYFFTP